MNNTQKQELLDEMVDELDRARNTKQVQIGYISDICDKSNNILLQIEASQKAKATPVDSTSACFKYSKETLHALAKTVETFERLINTDANTTHNQQSGVHSQSYLMSTRAKIDFLGSAVRKLLALNDTVNQIGSELRVESESEFESTDTSEGDANISE